MKGMDETGGATTREDQGIESLSRNLFGREDGRHQDDDKGGGKEQEDLEEGKWKNLARTANRGWTGGMPMNLLDSTPFRTKYKGTTSGAQQGSRSGRDYEGEESWVVNQ